MIQEYLDAGARASELLARVLGPEELEEYRKYRRVTIRVLDKYWIRVDMSQGTYVYNISLCEENRVSFFRLCAHPKSVRGMPVQDFWIGQILALKANPAYFLGLCNLAGFFPFCNPTEEQASKLSEFKKDWRRWRDNQEYNADVISLDRSVARSWRSNQPPRWRTQARDRFGRWKKEES